MTYRNYKGASKCKCLDCGEIRMVQRVEWSRAAQPRCYGCGGVVEICTDTGHNAQIKARDAAKVAKDRFREKGSFE